MLMGALAPCLINHSILHPPEWQHSVHLSANTNTSVMHHTPCNTWQDIFSLTRAMEDKLRMILDQAEVFEREKKRR
jgi:hypothetical protein